MPINSFDNYYMSFKPDKSLLSPPYFRSLAELLENEIVAGNLTAHTKLPPQRELADWLDVSLSTVTRAYALCEKKGLTYAVTGKGTFVSPDAFVSLPIVNNTWKNKEINMGPVLTFPQFNHVIAREIDEIYRRIGNSQLLTYDGSQNNERYEKSYKKWFEKLNMPVEKRCFYVTYGAQNGLAVILSSVFAAGDCIATDEYTYPNFKQLAIRLNIKLIPVRGDDFGMSPAELEKCCNENNISGVFLVPTCQNPLGYFMSSERKAELQRVIHKRNIILIENDVYGFLAESSATPISAHLPERGIFISSVSKLLSNGLRIAYISAPEKFREKIREGSRSINLFTAPMITEIATYLCESEILETVKRLKRKRAEKRNMDFDLVFGIGDRSEIVYPLFRWIKLPEKFKKMSGSQFEEAALAAGVIVYHSDRFVVGNASVTANSYVRVSLSTPSDEKEFNDGLKRLYDFLYG